MTRSALVLVGLLAACSGGGPAEVKLSQFKVVPRADGFKVLGPDAGVLLDSAGFAARKAKARFEAQYGSYKITDGAGAWAEGTRFDWNGAKATVRDAAGAAVGTLEITAPSDGVVKVAATATAADANRLKLSFACAAGDHFAGFGGQADGLDHRGHLVPIFTSEPGIGKSESDEPPELWFLEGARHSSSYGLPSFLSNRGFVAVLEHDGRSLFDLCKSRADAYAVEAWSNAWTFWLYFGEVPAQALERATAGLLGRPMKPPPVAFAPWNDAIFGSANVRAVAASLRDAGVPSSVLWTEDFRGGVDLGAMGYRLKEDWTVDRSLYPDAEAVAADLRAQGFSWHAYFNTFLVEDAAVYGEAKALGHFVGAPDGGAALFSGVTFKTTGLVDLSTPAARDWMKGYLRQALDLGFDGWMADYGEWLPPDAVLDSKEDPIAAHQRYPLQWAKLNAEVIAEKTDARQRVFFSRSGWLGSTAFTPVVWGGDQRTSFARDDGLYTVLPIGLNLGLGGVSTYGHDIAGYQSATNAPSTKELFFRWTTLGALSPVMRTHHGTAAKDNWRWDKDAETIAHYRRWATLHLRLFPYFDGASKDAEEKGMPLMRALPLIAPEDPAGWTLGDEYGLGPSLLVAPVVEEGAVKRKVHFPPGRWIPLEGGLRQEGPADVEIAAAMAEVPVYAREGTVLPLLPASVQTILPAAPGLVDYDDVKDARVLWIYPGASGKFVERDGTTYTLTADAQIKDALPAACTTPVQRGCTDGKTVRLDGQTLRFPGHRLEISGPPRTVDATLVTVLVTAP